MGSSIYIPSPIRHAPPGYCIRESVMLEWMEAFTNRDHKFPAIPSLMSAPDIDAALAVNQER